MSHIPRNNLPKQFCDRCFEQGDRKWQQDELELVPELDIRVCGRKMKCVGAGISGGATMGPQGRGRTLHPRGKVVGPLVCSIFHKSSNILEKKSYLTFRAFGELLFSKYFYIARIIR